MMSYGKEIIQELNQFLNEFKSLTLILIECLEKDEYDNLESLFNDRQVIIDRLNQLKYSQESFKTIIMELGLMPLQKKLTLIMNKCRTETRQEINKLSASKTANKGYNIKYKDDPLFFNKKI